MNHQDPMATNHLDDDTLSALLDGDTAGRAHLDTCATCSARLAAFEGARAALREPLAAGDGLDDLARARLIRTALAAARTPDAAGHTRRRAWTIGVSSVAAVAAVVALIGVLATPNRSSTSPRAALSAGASVRDAGQLGDVTTAVALQSALARFESGGTQIGEAASGGVASDAAPSYDAANPGSATAQLRTTSGGKAASGGGTNASPDVAAEGPPVPASPSAPLVARADIDRCADTLARTLHPGRFSLRGSALFSGRPAAVIGFEQAVRGKAKPRLRVYVTDPATCAVLQFAAR